MTLFAGLMGVLTLFCVGGLVFDHRILLGAPIWEKPFKFAISVGLYCLAWAWLTSLLTRGRRLAERVSAGILVLMTVEFVVLITQTVRGVPSHFNNRTVFDHTLYLIMGGSIAMVWVATLVLTVLLFRAPIADPANRLAIRSGMVISLVGIALGGLMVTPRPGQPGLQGLVGAHSVGVLDGGPEMPITGWDTTGGDLRIPHFVGIHGLQALPLFALLLGVLARRFPRLRPAKVPTRLVMIAAGCYAGLVALVTWQALRGQALIHPDTLTIAAFVFLVACGVIPATFTLARADADGQVERTETGAIEVSR
ncbi:MAG TPA: hypothetical protein VFG87_16325 [Amycolatopsis sp.]|nr:hypothetical protein [Amycolatopsis sp.]